MGGSCELTTRLHCRRTSFFLLSSLLCLSSFAPSRVSCQFEKLKDSAGKIFNSVKENLAPAVKKVADTASDLASDAIYIAEKTVSTAKRTVSEALGPDLSKEGKESCPKEGCPDDVQTQGGYSPPPTSAGSSNEGTTEGGNELAKVSEDDGIGLIDRILGSASTGIARVGRTLYDTLSDMTSRFADTVRKIMNEELYDLIASSVKTVGEAMFTPGATLFYLGETAASVSLFLFSLLLSYIFIRFFRLLSVLAFLSMMFLLHQVVGPIVLYEWIFWAGGYLLQIAYLMAEHYYITSVLTVVLFGYTTVKAIIRWSAEKSERQLREELKACVLNQSVKIDDLQKDLNKRIQGLVRGQEEIKRTLCQLTEALQTNNSEQTTTFSE